MGLFDSKGGMGALIGTATGGPIGGLIGGGLGMQMDAGEDAAKYGQRAALAQLQAAQKNYRNVDEITGKATTQSLISMDRALQFQERNLSRKEELAKQIDPTVLEASKQALALMRGEESKTLAPIKQQRQFQREKLLNSLREQLGPGAETSTAGIQALTRFDSETNSLLAGQQQQALQGLGQSFGMFSSFQPNIGAEAGALGGLAEGRAGLMFGRADRLNAAANPLYQSAGAPFTGGVLRAQSNQAMGSALMSLGGQLGGAAISGLMGGMGGLGGGGAGGGTSTVVSGGMTPAQQARMGSIS